MANKYPQQERPPPYQANAGAIIYPTAAVIYPTAATTVIHHKTVVQQVEHKPAKGLFGSIVGALNDMSSQLGKGVGKVERKINQAVDGASAHPQLAHFQSNNIVLLVSRSTGRLLQIVQSSGRLFLDGNGANNVGSFNTLWTVVNEGDNQVRLHNNYNFLTIMNGYTTLVHMPHGSLHGIETKFQLTVQENFVLLMSMKEYGRYVGILPDGQVKPASACGREDHAHFGVQLVSTPYASGANTTVIKS